MRKFIGLITLILALFIFIETPNAYDTVNKDEKVYDFAEKMSSSEKELLKQKIDNFIENSNMDLAVVTLNNYTGLLENYADDFYDYNGFGFNSSKDGLVIVLNYDYYGIDAWISTSGTAILMYDDNRIDSILSTMSVAKTRGTYAIFDEAIKKCDEYVRIGIPESNKYCSIDSNGEYRCTKPKKKLSELPFVPIIFVSLLISIISTIVMANKNKMVFMATSAGNYINKGTINITSKTDRFLRSNTTSYTVSSSSGSGGGSRSFGGSSTHHSSSGHSHGGGGRRL